MATSLVVVALIASRYGYDLIDGIMGVFVALIIFYSAYEIAREAVNPLLGEAPSKEMLKEIETLARSHKGVLGVHDIISHRYGQTSVISLHLEVSDKEPVMKLHYLSEAVEETITRKMGGMVIAHIDPVNRDHPRYDEFSRVVEEVVAADRRVHSFHDLRIVGCSENRCNVIFDIALEEEADVQETYDIVRATRASLTERCPDARFVIKAEPKYAYNP